MTETKQIYGVWTIVAANDTWQDFEGSCLFESDDQKAVEAEANKIHTTRPELKVFILPRGRDDDFHRKCYVNKKPADAWCKSKLVKNQKFYEFELVDYPELSERTELSAQLDSLENQITPRRLRESRRTDEGALWLDDIDAKIEGLKSKLP